MLLTCSFGQPIIAQTAIPRLDFDGLESYLKKNNDTTYVVNFWATWCAPCVKELPYFEELSTTTTDAPLKVILVSLDFPEQFDTKLIPFLGARKLSATVLFLDDGKANKWIPRVHPDWSGAIPATLIYKGDKRMFFEKSFTKEELFLALEGFAAQ